MYRWFFLSKGKFPQIGNIIRGEKKNGIKNDTVLCSRVENFDFSESGHTQHEK